MGLVMRCSLTAAVMLACFVWHVMEASAQQQLPAITVTTKKAPPKKTSGPAPAQAGALDVLPESIDASPYASSEKLGEALSSSEGVVPRAELLSEPIYRTGEMLEAVPGLVVTQHSGEGKANQYFLRGFNLDGRTSPSPSTACR